MPCIFDVFKHLKNSNLYNDVFEVFFAVFKPCFQTVMRVSGGGVPDVMGGMGVSRCFMPGNAGGNTGQSTRRRLERLVNKNKRNVK